MWQLQLWGWMGWGVVVTLWPLPWESCCCFLPGVALPMCHSRWCRLWHRLCLYIFNRISGTSFWSVLCHRLSFFTIPFHTTASTTLTLPAGQGRAESLVPSSMSWFQITLRAGFCTATLLCICLNCFVPLTCLPPLSCRHIRGSLQEEC